MNPARESGEGAGGDAAEALTGAAPVGPGDAPPVQSEVHREARLRGEPKIYLGDGAYVEFDGNGLILTAENGIEVTNRVYLEPECWFRLVDYVEAIRKAR